MSFAINVQQLLDRASKRAANVATVATLLPAEGSKVAGVATHVCVPVRRGGNPLMTKEQGDGCHAEGWSDAEIEAFTGRRNRLLRWGYVPRAADDLAERLTLRDREQDGRRLCTECAHGRGASCPNGLRLPQGVLHHCHDFQGAP